MQVKRAVPQRDALGAVDGQFNRAHVTVHLNGGVAGVGVGGGAHLQQAALGDEEDLRLQVQCHAFLEVQAATWRVRDVYLHTLHAYLLN